jgi:hypothetical protein
MKDFSKTWNRTKSLYFNWLINTDLKYHFFNKIKFESFSLWWVSNLVERDNINIDNWYTDLNRKLNGFDIAGYNNNFLFLRLLKKFISSILFNLLFKIIFKKKIKNNKKHNKLYCFHVHQINLQEHKNSLVDRQYGNASFKRVDESCYLIQLEHDNKILFNPFLFKRKIKKIPCKYYILNNFVSIREITTVYIKTFLLFLKTLEILSKKNYFIINKIDCSEILKPLLLNSFFGKIQDNLIYAIAARNFFKEYEYKYYLNYLEFYPSSRAFYYFIKNKKSSPKIITINHANFSKNNLFFFIKKKEFSKKNFLVNYSDKPDVYLTQGYKFLKFLKKTIPSIEAYSIGSLKIELNDLFLRKNINKIKINIYKKKISKKIISIWPGIGEAQSFISVLNKCNLDNFYIILKPHSVSNVEIIDKFKKDFKYNFVTENSLNNSELAYVSDFILTGYSSVALEIQMFKNNVIRIYDAEFPPLFDDSDGILVVNSSILLQKYLDSKISLKKINKRDIEKSFFYKYDKNCSNRLFKII